MRKQSYVLDSYAILAYFQAESAGAKVKEILKDVQSGEARAFLSTINLGEIYYIVGRRLGEGASQEILADISRLPIQLIDATTDRVLAAARIKTHYAVSYADAFAVALAQELNGTLITGDPDFRKVESLISLLLL